MSNCHWLSGSRPCSRWTIRRLSSTRANIFPTMYGQEDDSSVVIPKLAISICHWLLMDASLSCCSTIPSSHIRQKNYAILCSSASPPCVYISWHLGLTFDSYMSFSSMRNSVIKKVNAKLKFLYWKSALFGTNERQLLCSAQVNPHFEYACNAWHRSVNAKVKHKLKSA